MEERLLDDRSLVKGVIYRIEHTESGKHYVGQTVTHRLNKGKYRPYGVRRRNTKPAQSSCLYNAIRQYGAAAFTYHELEVCELSELDDREKYWIEQQGCLHPTGFNLTTGGSSGFTTVATLSSTPRGQARARGGCAFRTSETRERMSVSVKATMSSPEAIAKRSSAAKLQHDALKAERFSDITIDTTNLDQYIKVRKSLVLVVAGGKEARFTGKFETTEMLIDRAKCFLRDLCSTRQIATLPNCSGNP